jgi:hypothetical protein
LVALAIAAAGLWVALFRSTGGTVTATPAIPSISSQSIFAPATRPGSGLNVDGVVRNGACRDCVVHVGSGGLVRAEVPSGAGRRTAYALLNVGRIAADGQVLVHDVIGFGRGETPAGRIRLLQVLDSSHRVIFELVAGPDRHLYMTSPAGGLRATRLMLATGAIVPNDGFSGVAVDVALKPNGWVRVSVNGMRTASVRGLVGARTGPPRYLAAGVIGYKAPPHAAAITATHAQVSVSTSAAPAEPAAQPVPAGQPVNPTAPRLSSLAPPTISGRVVVGATLTAAPGSWSDGAASFTYAWERCDTKGSCTAIDGAESKTYELLPADSNAFVRVRVRAQVGDVSVSRASTSVGPVSPARPSVLTEPSISGDAVIGAQLTADPGRWSDPAATFTYAWLRCHGRGSGSCSTIDGAAETTYALTGDDVGFNIELEVTATNAGGSVTADSTSTDPVGTAHPEDLGAGDPSLAGNSRSARR